VPEERRPNEESAAPPGKPGRKGSGRLLVLAAAFLGWFCAGLLMSTTTLAMRSAAIDLLARQGTIDRARYQALNQALREQPGPPGRAGQAAKEAALVPEDAAQLRSWRASAQQWFAYYQCAMLLGAAAGGFLFGLLGDRFGRKRALAGAILCYSLLAGAASFAQTPLQLLGLWFFACLGIGGTWPNGVALLAETWADMSRPMVAGILGMAANVGIFSMATLATHVSITPEHWRWMMHVDAVPVLLGIFVLAAVPESPRWLASRAEGAAAGTEAPAGAAGGSSVLVFRPPLLPVTLVGILLATIPLIGGWGSANWMVPWAAEAGETANPPNLSLQAQVGQARSLAGIVGSLLGGWVAHLFGRRPSYCLVSLAALSCAQYAFWFTVPTDASFLFWVAGIGFFSGIYFGWLPLFLPELFPTRARSTGAGVCFNSGRILTAVTIFATGALAAQFGGDYARIGRITSLIYAVGILAVWLAPDTTRRQLKD
jgi:MFS transporter, SHS family, sialic acid transporter